MSEPPRTARLSLFVVRRVAFLAFLSVAACSSTVSPPAPNALDGAWTTRSSGVALMLTLTWTRDSVNGTGTYNAIGNTLGCGGGTLRAIGTVTLAASRSGSAIAGRMAFDNGWTPAYVGTLDDSTHINGAFQSIDRGPCAFPLFFGLVP